VHLSDTLLKTTANCYLSIVVPLSFKSFTPANVEDGTHSGPSHWLVFQGTDLLVSKSEASIGIPIREGLESLGIPQGNAHFLGIADGIPCRAIDVPPGSPPPDGWTFEGLRALFGLLSDTFFSVASRALEVLEWDRGHRFCGRCGAATTLKEGERARECPRCGHLSYPRISPAVIVAVVRGREILLARARRFPPGFYSVLAGFVEPGETLEECVAREVREETGIEVKNLAYFRSQPWPFPHSLMIAFTAEYAGGEIRVEESELIDAGWYSADSLPSIPDPITVARRLIDWFRSTRGQEARG
jgi:NAD+ diphosphatase